jgi:hypothetical protein
MKRLVFAALAAVSLLVGAAQVKADWEPRLNGEGLISSWINPDEEFTEFPYPSTWLVLRCHEMWIAYDLKKLY